MLIYSTPVTLFIVAILDNRHNKFVFKYFLFFLFVFIYGVILGLIYNNNINYIINNSAGFFTLMFVLSYSKYFEIIFSGTFIKVVAFTIFFQIIISLAFVVFTELKIYNSDNYVITTFLGDFKGGSSTGHFRMFSVKTVVSIYFFLILYIVELSKKNYFLSLIYLICSFILVIILASKGMITGYIFLLFISIFFSKKSAKSYLFILLLIGSLLFFFIQFDLLLLITATFDNDDIANANRLQQISYLFDSGFPFGRGFGALIQSEDFRSESSPYGFELSYFSYFHKFGLFILFFIVYPLYLFLNNIYRLVINRISFIEFSIILFSFLYIMPSVGNPLLFHPYHTFMFVVPIILQSRDYCKENINLYS